MKTILVVDDEKDLRDLLKARFEASGFKCLTAKDGREAIKTVAKERPDLIILDLVMPKMDGIQAYKALKADAEHKHIPIIVYTAQPPEIVAKKGEAAFDVVDFVLKPFDSKTLVLAVKKILGGQEQNNLPNR